MIIFTHFATPYNDRERFRMHTMRATKVPKTYIYFWCLVLLVKPYPSRIQGSNPALNEFQSVGPLSIVLRNCCPLPGVGGGAGGLIQIPLNTSTHLSTWSVGTLCKGQQRDAESQILHVHPHVLSQKNELDALVNPLSFTHYRSQVNIC